MSAFKGKYCQRVLDDLLNCLLRVFALRGWIDGWMDGWISSPALGLFIFIWCLKPQSSFRHSVLKVQVVQMGTVNAGMLSMAVICHSDL